MTQLRLSICIATYNRADYIGETLESIIPQITDEVEIVIVDGASTDGTSNVVKNYTKICKQINYIQLPSKGGVDQDFCKAVECAKGEYCWLFPDDDLLKPGAISAVLREIPKGYSLIVVNAQVMNKDFSKIIMSKRIQIDKNEIYSVSEMDLLFSRAVSYMSFIGAIVINHNLWMQREKEKYYGTEFIHVGVIFQEPLPAPTLLIAEPYIMIRLGNALWTSRAMEIWMRKWPDLLNSFTHISKDLRQKHQMIKPWSKFKRIVLLRTIGGYSLKEHRAWFSLKEYSIWWIFSTFFVAITPICFMNILMRVYNKMKVPRR
jgi:glycosyltransferase involved in cell wall biosynthesis